MSTSITCPGAPTKKPREDIVVFEVYFLSNDGVTYEIFKRMYCLMSDLPKGTLALCKTEDSTVSMNVLEFGASLGAGDLLGSEQHFFFRSDKWNEIRSGETLSPHYRVARRVSLNIGM
jgi:hypothetical protein